MLRRVSLLRLGVPSRPSTATTITLRCHRCLRYLPRRFLSDEPPKKAKTIEDIVPRDFVARRYDEDPEDAHPDNGTEDDSMVTGKMSKAARELKEATMGQIRPRPAYLTDLTKVTKDSASDPATDHISEVRESYDPVLDSVHVPMIDVKKIAEDSNDEGPYTPLLPPSICGWRSHPYAFVKRRAGSMNDVFKNTVLCHLIEAHQQAYNDSWTFVDFKAGPVAYDIRNSVNRAWGVDAAFEYGKWWARLARTFNHTVRHALVPFMHITRIVNIEQQPHVPRVDNDGISARLDRGFPLYPGTPAIVRAMMRPRDRAIFFEPDSGYRQQIVDYFNNDSVTAIPELRPTKYYLRDDWLISKEGDEDDQELDQNENPEDYNPAFDRRQSSLDDGKVKGEEEDDDDDDDMGSLGPMFEDEEERFPDQENWPPQPINDSGNGIHCNDSRVRVFPYDVYANNNTFDVIGALAKPSTAHGLLHIDLTTHDRYESVKAKIAMLGQKLLPQFSKQFPHGSILCSYPIYGGVTPIEYARHFVKLGFKDVMFTSFTAQAFVDQGFPVENEMEDEGCAELHTPGGEHFGIPADEPWGVGCIIARPPLGFDSKCSDIRDAVDDVISEIGFVSVNDQIDYENYEDDEVIYRSPFGKAALYEEVRMAWNENRPQPEQAWLTKHWSDGEHVLETDWRDGLLREVTSEQRRREKRKVQSESSLAGNVEPYNGGYYNEAKLWDEVVKGPSTRDLNQDMFTAAQQRRKVLLTEKKWETVARLEQQMSEPSSAVLERANLVNTNESKLLNAWKAAVSRHQSQSQSGE